MAKDEIRRFIDRKMGDGALALPGCVLVLVYTVDADLVRTIFFRMAARSEEAAYDHENS